MFLHQGFPEHEKENILSFYASNHGLEDNELINSQHSLTFIPTYWARAGCFPPSDSPNHLRRLAYCHVMFTEKKKKN